MRTVYELPIDRADRGREDVLEEEIEVIPCRPAE